jgi:hypothetical protein
MLPLFLAPLAFALGLAMHNAPARPAAGAADSTSVAAANQPAVIEFENQAWDQATVYAVPRSGLPVRLGDVMAGATRRFTVPRTVFAGASTVDIVARPFARRFVVRSGEVTLFPGDEIRASLAPAENMISVLPAR